MKKSILIISLLFLVSTILYIALKYVVNTQILSRILYGMDFNTYMNMQLQSANGFIGVLSNNKMSYDWVFTLSNWIIIAVCVFATYRMTKRIGRKYVLNKNELISIIIIFSILSSYELIFSLISYHRIISLQILEVPILFIIVVIIGSIKNLYKEQNNEK